MFSCVIVLLYLLSFTGCDTINAAVGTIDIIPENGLNIHMIDVGQGDSFLLECSDKYMLIDAGEVDCGDAVVEYLNSNNIEKLDYAVISHPHSDHYGGMLTVLENVDTENIVMTEKANTSRTWETLIDYIDRHDYNVIFPETGDTLNLGACAVTVFVPDVKNTDALNDCSIILRAEYNGMAALFTGDAEKSEERLVMDSGFDVSADVLKVGHHGSNTSTDTEFLQKVDPKLALISCGKNNEYGHPQVETTALLRKYSVYSRRTDQDGNVVVNLNEGRLTIITDDGTSSCVDINKSEVSSQTENDSKNTSNKLQSDVPESFVGNKNSHVFHTENCYSVEKMSEGNMVYFNNREDAVNSGYSPCERCKP